MAQDWPEIAEVGPKIGSRSPNMAQDRAKIAQDGPKIAEDGQTSVSHRGRWPIRTLGPYFAGPNATEDGLDGPNATEDGLDVRWTRILRVRTRRKSRKYRILRGGSDPGVGLRVDAIQPKTRSAASKFFLSR